MRPEEDEMPSALDRERNEQSKNDERIERKKKGSTECLEKRPVIVQWS